MRLNAQTAVIENGFVCLPEAAPWLAEYLAELAAFPAGATGGQVDLTAQFLAWTKKKRPPELFLAMMELYGGPGSREKYGY